MRGRPRKSLGQHHLEGTYRADRHGPLPPTSGACVDMEAGSPPNVHEWQDAQGRMRDRIAEGVYPGLDFDAFDRRLLVSADSLAFCLDTDRSTIRRWAKNGTMPAPLKVGGRVLWDAETIRAWIKAGCPTTSG